MIIEFDLDDKRFLDFLHKATSTQAEESYKSAIDNIDARIMRGVKKMTPVGQYDVKSGKKGGTLRRNWSIKRAKTVTGGVQGSVFDPVYYAIYVNYGHRLRNNKWWEGYHMLENTLDAIEPFAKEIFKRQVYKILKNND